MHSVALSKMFVQNALRRLFPAIVFFTALVVTSTEASIILKANNYTFDPLPDMPADFGPRIPTDGIEGFLVVADPEDACTPLINPVSEKPWIALIMRSQRVHVNCTFDVKVRNAENAGAVAAIVYDDVYEALIIMSRPKDHTDPGIPALFVSQRSGIIMKRMLQPGVTTVLVTPMSDAVWLSMLMSAFAGVLAVSVVIATFYFIRRHRVRTLPGRLGYNLLRNEEGMSAAQLRALPVVIFETPPTKQSASSQAVDEIDQSSSDDESGSPLGRKGGGTLKTCAVCLEDYKDGEKLRVLPCKHRFHMECIDQWLSSRKPLCPICKHDSLKPMENPESSSTDDQLSSPVAAAPTTGFRGRWRIWRQRQTGALPVPQNNNEAARPASSESAAATPFNFPGMHFARESPHPGAAGGLSSEIVAEEDLESGSLTRPLMADEPNTRHSQQQQDGVQSVSQHDSTPQPMPAESV